MASQNIRPLINIVISSFAFACGLLLTPFFSSSPCCNPDAATWGTIQGFVDLGPTGIFRLLVLGVTAHAILFMICWLATRRLSAVGSLLWGAFNAVWLAVMFYPGGGIHDVAEFFGWLIFGEVGEIPQSAFALIILFACVLGVPHLVAWLLCKWIPVPTEDSITPMH